MAGVINTLAGGGSLLTLPILIFSGLPPNIANGTNRVGLLIQSIFGTAGYHSKGISSYPFKYLLNPKSRLVFNLSNSKVFVGILSNSCFFIFKRVDTQIVNLLDHTLKMKDKKLKT